MKIKEWIRNKIAITKVSDNQSLYEFYDDICKDFGYKLNYESYTRAVRKITGKINNIGISKPESYEETKNMIKAERIFTRKPQTLEEVVEMFKIDSKIWECSKFSVSSWDVTSTRVGKTATNYSVKAEFKRRVDIINYEELKEKFINDVKIYNPNLKEIKDIQPNQTKNEDNLLEIDIFDLHFGKLCWGEETGEDYDHKIAKERFLKVINDIIQRCHNFNRILFVIGNDMFHFDTTENTTTRGTRQDADVRWQKMFDKGTQLLVEAINYLSQYAKVDVLLVRGNHDTQTSYYASLYVDAWFRNNDRVNVNASPTPRKYYHWGSNLIGFTHGDKEKNRLGGIMQIEQAQAWGVTKYREFHIGHRHSEHVVEANGVIIRSISSITGTDAWHAEQGYIGAIRKAQAFVWNKNLGLTDIINSVII
jgi:hypothetical protein